MTNDNILVSFFIYFRFLLFEQNFNFNLFFQAKLPIFFSDIFLFFKSQISHTLWLFHKYRQKLSWLILHAMIFVDILFAVLNFEQ